MNGKILVLGSTGNIGSLLLQRLQERNADFIAGTYGPEGMDKLKKQNIRGVDLDYGDSASLNAAMQGVERLFMLTPVSSQMVRWGENIIQSARQNDIRFILRISIMNTNPHSPHIIFRLHGDVDRLLRESGIPYAILQSNVFMQNFSLYWGHTIRNNDVFFTMHEGHRVSYIDMRDIADMAGTILTNPAPYQNREYTVTGSRSFTDQEVAGILSSVAGRKINFIPVDEDRFRQVLLSLGMSEWDAGLYVSLEHNILEGHHSVISDLSMAINGRMATTFEQFSRDYAQHWQKVPVGAPG